MPNSAPHCPIHPAVTLRCPACAGSKGGSATSPAKTRAARENAKKGGRPNAAQLEREETAKIHAEADARSGRDWFMSGCACGACRQVRGRKRALLTLEAVTAVKGGRKPGARKRGRKEGR